MGLFDKNSAPIAPDTSAISNAQADAAKQQSADSAAQLQWAQGANASDTATADKAVNGALGQQDVLNGQSATDLNTYNNVATPALQTLQTDANNYSNPGFKDQQVGGAIADQARAGEAARNNSIQSLEGYGVNPASTRDGALDIGTRMQTAANEATAGTAAGNNVDATARGLQQQVFTDASGVGAAGVNASTAGTAAGASASGTANATTATGAQAMGTGTQWAGLANNSTAAQDNTINSSYANQIAQNKANQTSSSGIGSLLGAGLGVAGAAFGGPLGAAVGNAVGGALIPKGALSGGFAEGGPVAHAAVGGPMAPPGATPGGAIPADASPTGGQATDDVPARLTAGEFVIPKDVTAWLGHKHFQSLIDKSREQAAQATAKPAVGPAIPQRPTFSSTPQQGAIPAQRAA